ncbi:hypothetical protein EDB89DRAFT_1368049 [Lactarius sanguifluus]|nr:hypothetical protein EDB89DRAFT_1368049 [Lactarius sanguifluus]
MEQRAFAHRRKRGSLLGPGVPTRPLFVAFTLLLVSQRFAVGNKLLHMHTINRIVRSPLGPMKARLTIVFSAGSGAAKVATGRPVLGATLHDSRDEIVTRVAK